MALTAALVCATKNRLTYLLTATDTETAQTLTIPNDGGVTPDLRTDAIGGPMTKLVNAGVTGIGLVAAGALTQGGARSLLLEDRTTNIGNEAVPRARSTVSSRAGDTGGLVWSVDANVDGQGDPVVAISVAAGSGTAYLDILVQHSDWE